MALRRETARLGRAFGALVLAISPLAAAQACSDASSVTEPAGTDATTGDAPSSDTPAADATADVPSSPPDGACLVVTEVLDAGPDVDPPCRYTLPCGLAVDTAFVLRGCGFYRTQADDGGDASLGCSIPERDGCKNGTYSPPANGSLSFECIDCLGGGGRRPVGLRRSPVPRAGEGPGDYFAHMAHDEAASVHAFARLHQELVDLGAPRVLADAASRSARDETRHARVMAGRARAAGAPVPAARVRRQSPRSLESLARENATEGCIRETYGALLLQWQAAHASEPSLRRLFARIAADETRHAALSWEVARWAEQKLDRAARARVRAARQRTLRDLQRRVRARAERDFDASVGHPRRTAAVLLLDGMVELLALA